MADQSDTKSVPDGHQRVQFLCRDKNCGYTILYDPNFVVPTTSTGYCKGCGGKNWIIRNPKTGEVLE
jgi:hypothetical protein